MNERPLRNEAGQTLEEFLAAYRPGDYERPCVTIDLLVFSLEEGKNPEILMVRRRNHPWIGCWALPGGFMEPGENSREAAARELYEECTITGLPLTQLGFFSDPGRDPRAWIMSCAYTASVKKEDLHAAAGDDAAQVGWFRIRETHEEKNGRGEMSLTLIGEQETVSARISYERQEGPFGTGWKFTGFTSDGIASDHCEMIAQALLTLGEHGRVGGEA